MFQSYWQTRNPVRLAPFIGRHAQGLLFYNAALSVPMLAVAVATSSEPATIRAYPRLDDRGFQVCCESLHHDVRGPNVRNCSAVLHRLGPMHGFSSPTFMIQYRRYNVWDGAVILGGSPEHSNAPSSEGASP